MKSIVSVLLLAFALPGVGRADTPADIVRVGDSQLSCEKLAAEINALTAAAGTAREAAAKRESQARATKGLLKGLAGGALSMAPSLLGGRGGMMTQLALNGALQGVQAGSVPAVPSAAAPASAPGPEEQRLAHLSDLFGKNGC